MRQMFLKAVLGETVWHKMWPCPLFSLYSKSIENRKMPLFIAGTVTLSKGPSLGTKPTSPESAQTSPAVSSTCPPPQTVTVKYVNIPTPASQGQNQNSDDSNKTGKYGPRYFHLEAKTKLNNGLALNFRGITLMVDSKKTNV